MSLEAWLSFREPNITNEHIYFSDIYKALCNLKWHFRGSLKALICIRKPFMLRKVIAFVKERFHNSVEIDILGIFWRVFIVTICPPSEKFFRGEIIQGEWRNFHRARALFPAGVEFHVLPIEYRSVTSQKINLWNYGIWCHFQIKRP